MAKTYRVTVVTRLGNAMVTALLRGGVKMGGMTLLTVRGRATGLPRTTPVTIVERDGRRWLVAPYGEVNWVRNLRAAGTATLRRGRRSETIRAVELSPVEAAPVLKESLAAAPAFIRRYFEVTPNAPLAAFEQAAPRHPVFEIGGRGAAVGDQRTPAARASPPA